VLLLGLLGAGLAWCRNPAPDDEAGMGDSKIATRQMEVLYGKSGMLMADLVEDLKQPDTQAVLIAAVAGLIAGGCFYVAGLYAEDDGGA
jgi:hypothetical protein